jgi:hypothetical protein
MTREARGNKALARAFMLVALKGFIMETEHKETVVEKAVAYVKDKIGIGDKAPDAKPDTPISKDAKPLDPDTFKSVGDLHMERLRREDGE